MAFRIGDKIIYPGMTLEEKISTTTTPKTTSGSTDVKESFDRVLSAIKKKAPLAGARLEKAIYKTTTPVTTTKTEETTPTKTAENGVNRLLSGLSRYSPTLKAKIDKALEKTKISTTPTAPIEETTTSDWYKDLKAERGIEPSPYLKQYGFFPFDPDYNIIKEDIAKKEEILAENIGLARKNVYQSMKNISQLKRDLALVQLKSNELWTVTGEGFDPDKQYTSAELAEILKEKINEAGTTARESFMNIARVPKWMKQKQELGEYKKDISIYEKLGYNVDILDDETIEVSLPKATDVHEWYVGSGKVWGAKGSDLLLGSTAFIESPLAVRSATDILVETAKTQFKEDPWGTMFGIARGGMNIVAGTIWDWATGKRDVVPEHTKERLSEYSLELSKSLKEGGGLAFGGKVLTSPAMFEGVYVPLATLGTSYVVTGLGAGEATVGATTLGGKLAKFGTKTGGKIIRGGIIGTGLGIGAIGVTQLGSGIYETAQAKPEELPGMFAETAFTFGMAMGGWKTGEALWKSKHTGSWHYNWKTGKTEWTPYEIPKPKNVEFIQPEVIAGEFEQGKAFFTGESYTVMGEKPVEVWFKGIAELDLHDPRYAIARGSGYTKMTEPKTLWGRNIGESSWLRTFEFETPSVLLKQGGKTYLHFTLGKSELGMAMPGAYAYGLIEPTYSRGLTLSAETGGYEVPLFKTSIEEGIINLEGKLISGKKYGFFHTGKYTSGKVFGDIKGMGKLFTYQTKIGGGGASGGGAGEGISFGGESGLIQKFDFGTVMDVISGKAIGKLELGLPSGGSKTGVSTIALTKTVEGASASIFSPYQSYGGQQIEQFKLTEVEPIAVWGGGGLTLITKQEKKQEYHRKKGSGKGVRPIFVSEIETEQKLGEIGEWMYKPVQEPVMDLWEKQEDLLGLGTGLDMGVMQLQIQEQQQEQGLLTGLNLLTINTPFVIDVLTPEPIPPIHKYPVLPKDVLDERRKEKRKNLVRRKRPILLAHEMDKGLLADLASVTRSHGRYGIATHPRLTENIWRIGERSMFMHVPTVELMMGKKKKKKKKKTKKKLDITNRRMADVLM